MKCWTTKDGRELKISEMETSHIESALHMMQRRARRWFLKLSLNAIAYASDAPDGAAMAAEEASNRLFDAAFDPNRCYLELLSRNEVARAMQAELLIRGEKFNAGVWR